MNIQCGRRVFFFLIVAMSTAGVSALGQVPTGTILGTVKDSQGLAVPAASVTLTNEGTSQTQTDATSTRGAYQFTHLNFGLYQVEVSKAGFKNSVVKDIKLDASTEYSVPPVVLELGPLTETVTVEAGPNLVRTAGAEITDTIENKQIEELPILDRNPLNLLSTQAGVSQAHRNFDTFVTVIDGQRQSFSNLTLDGINVQDNFIRSASLDYTPNFFLMSQVAEFTTTTQNAGPQAGTGASQVSIVTPSGTNNWHGEGFWNYKTGAWAANDWFNDANGIAKPNLLLNQAGGNIGGPIRKDKLFVYGAYELFRFGAQRPTNTTILTTGARSGIFQWRDTASNSLQCARIVAVPSVALPPGCADLTQSNQPSIDPVIASLLAAVPTTINNPAIGDGLNTGGYSFNQRDDQSRDNISVRLDWNPSARHSFSGTYDWNRFFADRPGSSLGLPDTYSAVPVVFNNEKNNFLSAAWRWTPTANFTNEVRFGFDLAPVNFLTNQQFGAFTVSSTLFNNPDQNEFPSSRNTHTWEWQDNASWSHGNHMLNFGMQVQRVTVFATNAYNTVPNLNLDYLFSGNAGLSPGNFPGGISDFDLATANQLLATLGGLVGSETQTFNATSTTSGYVPGAPISQNFRYNNWSLYAGDSWKFRRNLTLTYGLRWEYNSPFNERDGLLQFPVVPAGQTIRQTLLSDATLAYFGGNTGRSVYQKKLRDFAPNIGIAWDPFGDGKTSIRAGYSINYVNDELIGAPYNASLSNPGVGTQTGPSFLSGVTTSSPQAIPVPTMSDTFSGNWINLYNYNTGNSYGYAVDPNLSTPYVQQWNLSVQREIGWNSSVTVSYVGNRGTKLYRAIDLNQVIINSNGFLQAFNSIRQNGFDSLAATGAFNICYAPPNGSDCTSSNPNPGVAYFYNNFFTGLLDYPGFGGIISQYVQQGAVGDLADLYHSIGYDAAYFGAPVALAPNQYLRAADLLGNYSSSTYNAGIVEIRRRFRQGLNFQASYAFSKVFTDYSADTASGVQRFFPYLDNANPGLEKERANFDLTHAFKANFLYELPFGKGRAWSPSNRIVSQLVSGWTTSSIFTWQSGAPFSILSGEGTLNRSARSVLTNTADTTSAPQQLAGQLGVYQSSGEVLLINPKYIGSDGRGAPNDALTCAPLVVGGFCNPQPGTVGNLPRNAFNGPAFFDWDLSLMKSVPITESRNLKLRLDVFNVPNHPVFAVGDPNYAVANSGASPSDMYINDPKFGVATSTASSPRVVQVGLVFAF
jgi:Carboxypeptidase regulatory-like domain